MNESKAIARYIFETNYDNIPAGVADVSKKALLDGIGVILGAGTVEPACRSFVDLAIDGGGKQESTIIGFGAKVPSYMAAFANGSMAHALDFEDTHEGAIVHSNAAVIPAALAVAESIGGISGKELIAAVTLGSDIVCRMGLAFKANPLEYGWYLPPILNAFGATAAASKLLKISADQILDAFSLCLCQATCSAEIMYNPDSVIRAVRDSFAAKTGVMSALLAKKEIRGFAAPFEGKAGFFSAYARGNFDPDVLIKDLGTLFESGNISFKPWPSCRGTHAHIEGALAIMAEHQAGLEDVESVNLVVGENSIARKLCEPLENKRHPTVAIDAKFSIPFCVASALVHGGVNLSSFSDEALKDNDVQRIAEKITYSTDPQFGWKDAVQGFIEITLKNKGVLTMKPEFVYGNPQAPISMESLASKFTDCAAYAVKKIDTAKAIDMLLNLEKLQEVGDVMATL